MVRFGLTDKRKGLLSRNTISQVRKLRQQKFRQQEGLFIAEGDKLVREFLEGPLEISQVYGLAGWIEANRALLSCPFDVLSTKELGMISGLSTPNQVLALVNTPEYPAPEGETLHGMVLALDGIRDPGNLGTIIRTADWFGIGTILASNDTVECWNPKVVQASMGSLNRVRVIYTELPEYLGRAGDNMPAIGTFMDAPGLYGESLPADHILVIGSEASGIRDEVARILSRRTSVPAFGKIHGESLNAAVTAAIFCSEYRRQHP